MDKAYEGFLQSRLMWQASIFEIAQFDLPLDSLIMKNLAIVPRDRRLGHQAEFVFLELLNASPIYEVVAHFIQLIEQKKTLGELDYIVKDIVTDEILHIELTYKFYILDPTITEPIGRLVGPNRKDTFLQKLSKTRDKQLPLLYSVPSREILGNLNIKVEEIRQMVAFYGHVFLPIGMTSIGIEGVSEDTISGYWISHDQFTSEDESHKDYVYYLPFKYEWLHIPHSDQQWISHNEIVKKISDTLKGGRSEMLWKRDAEEEGILVERFFVIP